MNRHADVGGEAMQSLDYRLSPGGVVCSPIDVHPALGLPDGQGRIQRRGQLARTRRDQRIRWKKKKKKNLSENQHEMSASAVIWVTKAYQWDAGSGALQ